MNDHTHSQLSLGLVALCVGMLAVMTIPFFLRSSANKVIDVPPEERDLKRLTAWEIGKVLLVLAAATLLLLGLSRVIHGGVLTDVIAIVILVVLFVIGRKSKRAGTGSP
jgi:hypothetical protein